MDNTNNQAPLPEYKFSTSRLTTAQWVMAIGIVALAAILRLVDIGEEPLWLDEGYSWWDAQQSLSRLWSLVPLCDPHPPLYFLALKGWIGEFGDSSQAMRALSALFGVATTVVVILAGREIDTRVGWLAGLMFALSPFQIFYGREARPYALLCFGAALMVLGALRIVRLTRQQYMAANAGGEGTPEKHRLLRGWVSLIAGGSIVLWTNNTAIFLVAAMLTAFGVLLLFDRPSRTLLKPLIICTVLIVVLWLPYLPVVLEQTRGVVDDFWIPTPSSAWRIVEELSGPIAWSVHDAVVWAALVLLGGLLLMWRRDRWREGVLLACLIALPIALNYVFSVMVRPIFLSRSMIGITPAVVIAMAVAVLFIKSAWLRHAAVAGLLLAHIGVLPTWDDPDLAKEPWDEIAQALASESGQPNADDEIVLLTANELALPLEHALKDLHVTIPVQGAPANFPSPGMHARYPSGKCAPSLLNQDLSAIARMIERYRVVHFITRTNNVYDPDNRIVKLLRSVGYAQIKERDFSPGELEVYKFVLRHKPIFQSLARAPSMR